VWCWAQPQHTSTSDVAGNEPDVSGGSRNVGRKARFIRVISTSWRADVREKWFNES
jgi:hypothetical protein